MKFRTAAALAAFAGAANAQTLYVTDQQGGVTTLDAKTLAITGKIDIGAQGPRGIAVTHDGTLLLTANQGSGNLSVIERATGKILAHIPIGPSTEMVRVQGRTAYATYEPPTDKGGVAHIAVVDLDQRRVVNSIPSGHETEGLEFSPDGKYLLVTNEGDDTVSIYNLPAGTLAHSVDTKQYGTRPRGIKRLPDGSGYIVSLEFSDKFIVLDKDFAITKAVPTAASPYGLAFSLDGSKLFVAAAKAGLIQVFDAKTYDHLSDIKVGKRCWHFSFTPDAKHIVAACGRSAALSVVDAAQLKPEQSIEGFKLPWGIVAYPNTNGTLDTAK
ncbi:MAG: beta-propeller fold lactonase family protein [Rhodospirillales bacterium]